MPHLLRAISFAAILAISARAQNASFTSFGAASGETSTGQQLAVTGLPRLGTTFSLSVTYQTPPFFCLQVLTPYAAWLVMGTSNQSWQGIPLPAALPLGFDLLVSPDVVAQSLVTSNTSCPPGASGAFPAPFAVAVPNQPGLIGFQLHAQIVMARVGAPASAPPIATNGGTATVGF